MIQRKANKANKIGDKVEKMKNNLLYFKGLSARDEIKERGIEEDIYFASKKRLKILIGLGMGHIRRYRYGSQSILLNNFFFEVIDESLDCVHCMLGDCTQPGDFYDIGYYTFLKEAGECISFCSKFRMSYSDIKYKWINPVLLKSESMASVASFYRFDILESNLELFQAELRING